ncbi:MAG: STAS domain-containing protein [Vulcanimicrobiaceae bacterium]
MIEGASIEDVVGKGISLVEASLSSHIGRETPHLRVYVDPGCSCDGSRADVVHLAGELDLNVRESLDRTLSKLTESAVAIIDLTDVGFADTTLLNAVARLLRRRKMRCASATPVRIVGASPMTVRIFHITHLDTRVHFYASLPAARANTSMPFRV